jgi:hypothetical protein
MSQEPNRMLEFLTARPKVDGDGCRSNRRRPSSSLIDLSWLDEGCWRSSRARLLDISRGGAGVLCGENPPVGSLARLRFVEGEGSPWVEVKILGSEPQEKGRFRVRLRFEGHCPSIILRLAVLGPSETDEECQAVPRYRWQKAGSK